MGERIPEEVVVFDVDDDELGIGSRDADKLGIFDVLFIVLEPPVAPSMDLLLGRVFD